MDKDATPKFRKARPVQYALKSKIETELSQLEKQGAIKPVEFSQWAVPIVPIVKGDGTIRICGDANSKQSPQDRCIFSSQNQGFASVTGGQLFTKLDLAHA